MSSKRPQSVGDGDDERPAKVVKAEMSPSPQHLGSGSFAAVYRVVGDTPLAVRIPTDVDKEEREFESWRLFHLQELTDADPKLLAIYGGRFAVVTLKTMLEEYPRALIRQILEARCLAAGLMVDKARDKHEVASCMYQRYRSAAADDGQRLKSQMRLAFSDLKEAEDRQAVCRGQRDRLDVCGSENEVLSLSNVGGATLFVRRPSSAADKEVFAAFMRRAVARHILHGLVYADFKPANTCTNGGQFMLVDAPSAIPVEKCCIQRIYFGNNQWIGMTDAAPNERTPHPQFFDRVNEDPAILYYLMLCSVAATCAGKDDTRGLQTLEHIAAHYPTFPWQRHPFLAHGSEPKLPRIPMRMVLRGLGATDEELEQLAPEPEGCPIVAEEYDFWRHITEERFMVLIEQVRYYVREAQILYYDAGAGPDEDYMLYVHLSSHAEKQRDHFAGLAAAKVDQGVRHGCFTGAEGVRIKQSIRRLRYSSEVLPALDEAAARHKDELHAGRQRVADRLLAIE